MPPITLLLSAGEASGDMYAARLAVALKQRADVEIFGMGGPQMRAAQYYELIGVRRGLPGVRVHRPDRFHQAPASVLAVIIQQALDRLKVRGTGICHTDSIASPARRNSHKGGSQQAKDKRSFLHLLLPLGYGTSGYCCCSYMAGLRCR